jgi:thiol:disulfide interchange protein
MKISKKIILPFLLLCLSGLQSIAQDQISWKIFTEPSIPVIGEKAKLIFEANIKSGWHIYGTEDGCDGMGPLLTVIKFDNKTGFETTGKLKAIGFHRHMDDIFGCEIVEKNGLARFELPIKALSNDLGLKGIVDFMVCKDEGSCIPLDYVFNKTFLAEESKNIKLSGTKTATSTEKTPVLIPQTPTVPVNPDLSIFNSSTKEDTANISQANTSTTAATQEKSNGQCARKAGWDDIDVLRFEGKSINTQSWGEILWFIFGAFLAGLVTVFTPCVFPMLPMTVTFFTKKNKTKSGAVTQALIYGLSIVAIYTSFGVVVGKTFGEEFVNELSVNWVVNLIFFIIFIVFALSFMGMFEITLPNSVVNKVDAQADKGGYVGTFFMALALVLVSFSCTGPIVGSIIILAAKGEWILPTLTMLAFSLAFALPFTISAMFPSLLSKLPKSGGWLNSIKVVLGLLELALALKFLSQIDQVKDLGILDREVFITIWIAIFLVIAAYLFGKIRFPHDSEIDKVSVPRGVLGISALGFAIYLLPGLWGAPLKSFAGIFPPMHTQDFVLGNTSNDQYLCDKPMYGDQLHVAHDIKGYFDLRQAICCAREQKKPLFIDFTGKTCSNCRLMEQKVWSDNRVLNMLKEDFVVVSLYTDYNLIELPKPEQYTSASGREITTLGKSLQDFQKAKYNELTLPMYSIVSVEDDKENPEKIILKELTKTYSFNSDVKAYIEFLSEGKKNFIKASQK